MSVIDSFLTSPSMEKLCKLKKDDIVEIGKELELGITRSMRKTQLVRIVAEHMVDNDVFDVEELCQLSIDTSELSQAHLELEKAKIEAEAKVRGEAERAKAEIEKARIEQETRFRELDERRELHEARSREFDLAKQVRLVPQFNEADVDKYFQHFEKVASSLAWSIEMWPILLQTALKGRAQEAYAALSVRDCAEYSIVKSAILKSYELVPEAYRQKFRAYRKGDEQTYVEFSRQKETYFDRWCLSKDIEGDHDK